jgi:hypothetical protein
MTKTKSPYLIILSVLLFFQTAIKAVNFGDLGLFTLGIGGGIVFHELGHVGATFLRGGEVTDFHFRGMNYDFHETDQKKLDSKIRTVALGGYFAQTLATELIFQQKNHHDNPYAMGWMMLGIYVNLSNPIRYYLFNQKDNDLGLYAKHGGNPAIPATLMVAYSAFTIYRMIHKTDIPVFIGKDMLGFTIPLK